MPFHLLVRKTTYERLLKVPRDLAARRAEALELIGQELQARRLQGAVGAREDVRSHLDDDGVGRGDHFLADGIDHDALSEPAACGQRLSWRAGGFVRRANRLAASAK
jgi:hypothetical protein